MLVPLLYIPRVFPLPTIETQNKENIRQPSSNRQGSVPTYYTYQKKGTRYWGAYNKAIVKGRGSGLSHVQMYIGSSLGLASPALI